MFFRFEGIEVLKSVDDGTVEKYGFVKKQGNDYIYFSPNPDGYLMKNIVCHLSKPFIEYTTKNLGEYSDAKTMESSAKNTIWWEQFIQKYPNFPLMDITSYHYKKWHFKNLLIGDVDIRTSNKT